MSGLRGHGVYALPVVPDEKRDGEITGHPGVDPSECIPAVHANRTEFEAGPSAAL
jgi:hypothetical protein